MSINVANALFKPSIIKTAKITIHKKKSRKPRSLFNAEGFKFKPLKIEKLDLQNKQQLSQEFNDNGYAEKIERKLKEVTATKSKIREGLMYIKNTMEIFDLHIQAILNYLLKDTTVSRTLQARAEILSNLLKEYPNLIETSFNIFKENFSLIADETPKEPIIFSDISSKLEVFFVTFKEVGCNYVIDFINKLLNMENQTEDLLNIYYFFIKYCSQFFAKNNVAGYNEIFEKLGPISKAGKRGNSLAGTYHEIVKNKLNYLKYDAIQ